MGKFLLFHAERGRSMSINLAVFSHSNLFEVSIQFNLSRIKIDLADSLAEGHSFGRDVETCLAVHLGKQLYFSSRVLLLLLLLLPSI